jgi:hypothetical protein
MRRLLLISVLAFLSVCTASHAEFYKPFDNVSGRKPPLELQTISKIKESGKLFCKYWKSHKNHKAAKEAEKILRDYYGYDGIGDEREQTRDKSLADLVVYDAGDGKPPAMMLLKNGKGTNVIHNEARMWVIYIRENAANSDASKSWGTVATLTTLKYVTSDSAISNIISLLKGSAPIASGATSVTSPDGALIAFKLEKNLDKDGSNLAVGSGSFQLEQNTVNRIGVLYVENVGNTATALAASAKPNSGNTGKTKSKSVGDDKNKKNVSVERSFYKFGNLEKKRLEFGLAGGPVVGLHGGNSADFGTYFTVKLMLPFLTNASPYLRNYWLCSSVALFSGIPFSENLSAFSCKKVPVGLCIGMPKSFGDLSRLGILVGLNDIRFGTGKRFANGLLLGLDFQL